MFLTFSGLDGAGKSTLIAFAYDSIRQKGLDCRTITMYDHVGLYAMVRQLRDKLLGRPKESPKTVPDINPVDGSPAIASHFLLKMLRTRLTKKGVLLVDIALFRLYRIWYEVLCRKILIVDRFFYDSLVDIADGTHWRFIDWCAALLPTPALPCFIDVDAATSFARKGEYSVEYLDFRYRCYKRIFSKVQNPFFLANNTRDSAQTDLRNQLEQRIFGRKR